MLAVAAAGAGPLWLHQGLHHFCEIGCHSQACDTTACEEESQLDALQVDNRSSCSSCCPDSGASGDLTQSPADNARHISEGDHECGLCHNLAQPQVLLLVQADDLVQTLPDLVETKSVGLTYTQFSRPPPSRGPPSIG